MLDCPKCRSLLVRCQNEFGNFWHCGSCEGTAITVSLLIDVCSHCQFIWLDVGE